jgi:hypothetical protein
MENATRVLELGESAGHRGAGEPDGAGPDAADFCRRNPSGWRAEPAGSRVSVYIVFGAIPVLLGLAANLLLPEDVQVRILPALAGLFLSPVLAVVFIVALVSAVLSTIDSAILGTGQRACRRTCFPAGLACRCSS